MKNLKYKLGILLGILFILMLVNTNKVYGTWVPEGPNFTYYLPRTFWSNNGNSYVRTYVEEGKGENKTKVYRVKASTYKISHAKSFTKRTFYWKGEKIPKIDKTYGIFCIEHDTDVGDDVLDDSVNPGDWPGIGRNIIINGHSLWRDLDTSESTAMSGSETIRAARVYAYLLTYTGDMGPGPGRDRHTKQPLQKAIWNTCKSYLKNVSIFDATDKADRLENKYTNNETKTLQKEAEDYASMPPLTCNVVCYNSVWKQDPSNSSNYIVGPFVANFPRHIGSKSKLTFADEYGSTVNGQTIGYGTWNYCNEQGQNINIASRTTLLFKSR